MYFLEFKIFFLYGTLLITTLCWFSLSYVFVSKQHFGKTNFADLLVCFWTHFKTLYFTLLFFREWWIITLREKRPYSEFFWSVFFCIWTKYGEILCMVIPNAGNYRLEKILVHKHFSRKVNTDCWNQNH